MKTITESNENYSIIDLTLEYENWAGTERYAVISDFDQEYLEQNYSSELSAFKPYLFMTRNSLMYEGTSEITIRSLKCVSCSITQYMIIKMG